MFYWIRLKLQNNKFTFLVLFRQVYKGSATFSVGWIFLQSSQNHKDWTPGVKTHKCPPESAGTTAGTEGPDPDVSVLRHPRRPCPLNPTPCHFLCATPPFSKHSRGHHLLLDCLSNASGFLFYH